MPAPSESHLRDDPLLGRQLANFRIERSLGRGGMAQVYYGWDVKLQRPVAVKVIDARYRDNPAYAERFVREAQTIAKWRHEHIIHIYYADDQNGLYYFAMEYIDGPDLGQLIAAYAARGELMPHAEVLRIGRAVASALDYAHERGIIHRDVKPSNVMVAEDGRVVLTDFGLALDVQQGSLGEIFGSAHYLAPEQARDSAAAVPQSDLYALGVMLYEMLTGVVPFDDPAPTAVAVQHMTALPPPPRDINPDLNQRTEAVLLKALSKSPRLRFQTGSELIQALEQALSSSPMAAAKPLPLPEAALYRDTQIAQPMPLPSSPAVPPASRWPEQPPAPFLPGEPVYTEPIAVTRPNNLLLAATGLGLIVLIGCGLLAFLLFLQRGSRSEAASGGVQPPPPSVITFTATLPPSATPLSVFPTLPSSPTPTHTPTATPPAVVLLTLTPTSIPVPTEVPTPVATLTPTIPVPTDTPTLVLPTTTPTEPAPAPTDTPITELPTSTPAAASTYTLLIARRSEDSLFVVNESDAPFPLASLRLENKTGAINGTEWGIELLDRGACVAVWRNGNDPESPEVACTQVGEHLTRQKGKRFWEKAFNIYYNRQLIDRCNQDQCQVTIPIGAAE